MEAFTNSVSSMSVLQTHGTKRTAATLEPLTAKRVRGNHVETGSDSEASDYEPSECSSYTNPCNTAGSNATTPLTPSSPKASPKYPSDLNKSYHCPYDDCGKSFNRPAKLAQHVRSHTNTRPFVCPHAPCTKDFLRESHLKHHIKSAHSGIRDYACEWEGCGKSFITATRLRRHYAAHEGREKFRCTITGCGQTFRKHGTLQKHITTLHEGRDPFECIELNEDGQECGAGFDTEGKLKSHVGRVHGTKTYVCTICSFQNDNNHAHTVLDGLDTVFSSHATLQAHLASEHPPTCTECGLECTSQSALKSHIEVIHGDLSIDERRTHICPEPDCGRGFTKKGNLNAHIQISHNGKRFICGAVDPKNLNHVGDWDGSDACGEVSTSKRNLERHIRAVHLGLESSGTAKEKGKRDTAKESSHNNQVSIFTRLTGAGYEKDSGRHILCLAPGCDYRFTRDYDLEIHLQARHGLADAEVQELLKERDFCSPQMLQRPPYDAADQGFGAPDGLDLQWNDDVEMKDYMEPFEPLAHEGGDFWLGGKSERIAHDGDVWWHGEGEAQRVVMEGREEVEIVDPSLR